MKMEIGIIRNGQLSLYHYDLIIIIKESKKFNNILLLVKRDLKISYLKFKEWLS